MKRTSLLITAMVLMASIVSSQTWTEYRDEVNTGIIRGGNIMSHFTEANDGSIWASNTTGSLVRLNGEEITIIDDLKRSIAAQTNIGVITYASERQIGVWWISTAVKDSEWVWFVSNRGIALWDGNVLMQATDKQDDEGRMIFFAESTEDNYIIKEGAIVKLEDKTVKVRDPIINMYTVLHDSKGTTWFGGFKGSLFSISDGVWKAYDNILNIEGDISNEKGRSVIQIFEDSKKRIWILANEFVARYEEGEFIHESGLPKLELAAELIEDKDGNIWIAAKSGVYKFDGAQWTSFLTGDVFDEKTYFAGAIEEDQEGNIWFLTTTNALFTKPGYVYKYDGSSWDKHKIGKKSLLMDMTIDNKGRVWVAEMTGLYGFQDEKWITLRKCPFMRSFNKLYEDSQGRMWIGRGSFTGEIDMYEE